MKRVQYTIHNKQPTLEEYYMQYKNTLHIKTVQYTIQNIQNTLKEYNMQ